MLKAIVKTYDISKHNNWIFLHTWLSIQKSKKKKGRFIFEITNTRICVVSWCTWISSATSQSPPVVPSCSRQYYKGHSHFAPHHLKFLFFIFLLFSNHVHALLIIHPVVFWYLCFYIFLFFWSFYFRKFCEIFITGSSLWPRMGRIHRFSRRVCPALRCKDYHSSWLCLVALTLGLAFLITLGSTLEQSFYHSG